ncbi:MAG: NUDIX hydrolase [Patescibacteria group bacterium]|nr:NUDIX hydrolase [Patescibacteria group bacterium]
MITRIAGIIIKNEKILMLKGKGYEELWTPGGKVDGNETDEEYLRRELKEEIGINLTNAQFFKEYDTEIFYNPQKKMIERSYICEIEGKIKPDAEIESFIWFSKEDYGSKKYPMITHTQEELIPDLINNNIW